MACFTSQHIIPNLLNIYSYDAGSNLELLAVPPVNLVHETSTSTSAVTVGSNYELVVTVEMSRWDEQRPQQLSDIVSCAAMYSLTFISLVCILKCYQEVGFNPRSLLLICLTL